MMTVKLLWSVLSVIPLLVCPFAYDGLVSTPPMGWLAWERFRCNTDCKNYPQDCISEDLFMVMANHLVDDGYREVGYDRINIDDCWMSKHRDKNGVLIPDPIRFSHGIKFLAEYMHERGLKLGIYGNYGRKTCMGYPGMLGHLEQDIRTYAEWGADMLKLDSCFSDTSAMNSGYLKVKKLLNESGQPIVYSCSWPYYQFIEDKMIDYELIKKTCNLWRNYHDITISILSILDIIDFYGNNQEVLVPLAGPGHWNDPDMLLIGNPGLHYEEAKIQMGMWAILAAPLLMSNDLRNIEDKFKEILLNKDVIGINQDQLGIQGKRIYKNIENGIEIWARIISPQHRENYSFAIAILNRNNSVVAKNVNLSLDMIGMYNDNGYDIKDLFVNKDYGIKYPSDKLNIRVNSIGIVLLRAVVQTG